MRGLKNPFKAPRQVRKEKGTARQSESDDDEIPFSELKEKVIAETQMIRLLSEREANETAMFGEVLTWSDDDNATAVSLSQLAEILKATPRTSGQTPP